MSTYKISQKLKEKFEQDHLNGQLATNVNVTAAMDIIDAVGDNPTYRNIQTILVGANHRKILQCMKFIKEHGRQYAEQESTTQKITLDTSIIQSIELQLARVAATSVSDAEEELVQLAEVNKAISENLDEAESLIEDLRADIDGKKELIQQQVGQLSERAMEVASVKEIAAESVKVAELKADRERIAAEELRQELVKYKLEAATLPVLQAQIHTLSDQIDLLSTTLSESRKTAAVALAEKSAQFDRAEEYRNRENTAIDRIQHLENQLSDAASREHEFVSAIRSVEKELSLANTRVAVLETKHRLPIHLDLDVSEEAGQPL